ncbi:hypothetical protein BCR32DRAFT_251495 [Anaeromyces robustus]|uniref:Rpn family recombination-promoting nuclease/putative transposase n=1 Tax=Anaeromyces robustus TaxID=1754192 RepID=A0A1Y1VQQ6_9FUNG|nr:hypothetical protein BCR32DRAFT_251495 [Anaeromyces robustus]|eukprot:ORX63631.1 hypothetical protein BCR32DRAFT_251495 [Anaeromyces robustus]
MDYIIDINNEDIDLEPKYDIIFKNIFGVEKNKDVMIDFLNNILNLEDKIINIEFINPELTPVTADNSLIKNSKNRKKKKENEERKNSGNNENIICNENKNGKSGRMDVLVQNLRQLNMKTKYNKTESKSNYNYLYRDKEIVMVTETKNHEFIIIEIQFPKTGNLFKRSLFYASGTLFHSIPSREKYEEIPNVILINILNYNLFIDPEDMKQCHRIFEVAEKNTKKGKGFEDLIKFHFIELPKFKNESNETMKKQFPWILFLLDPNNNYFRTEKTPTYFLKARETLYELSRDKYIRESYKQITKQWSDIKSVAHNGFKDGIKEGIEEGQKLESIKIVLKSILKNYSIDDIIDLTGLSKENINYLKTLIDNKEYNINELESKFNIEPEDFDKICKEIGIEIDNNGAKKQRIE